MAPTLPDHFGHHGAELEALARIDAVRTVLDAFLAGHWALDSELVHLCAELVHRAGDWCTVADRLRAAA